jgi:predicted transcriptional regulator
MIERRTFEQIRKTLIRELSKGERNLNQLARATKVNWRTAENHLIYLIGRGYAIKTVDSPYVKIFRITDKGSKVRSSNSRL